MVKIIYPKDKQDQLRDLVIEKLKLRLLPDSNIIKFLLIGSATDNTFGEYSVPNGQGRLYSDFTFIVFIEDSYSFPDWLEKDALEGVYQFYNKKNFLFNKYELKIGFVYKEDMELEEDFLRFSKTVIEII
ncbi:MAG: hypothetical protein Q8Q35_01305 [Nanoarchaeota archaeon]|nr:hypothetical protein [Nanoarchaeota archaeon]